MRNKRFLAFLVGVLSQNTFAQGQESKRGACLGALLKEIAQANPSRVTTVIHQANLANAPKNIQKFARKIRQAGGEVELKEAVYEIGGNVGYSHYFLELVSAPSSLFGDHFCSVFSQLKDNGIPFYFSPPKTGPLDLMGAKAGVSVELPVPIEGQDSKFVVPMKRRPIGSSNLEHEFKHTLDFVTSPESILKELEILRPTLEKLKISLNEVTPEDLDNAELLTTTIMGEFLGKITTDQASQITANIDYEKTQKAWRATKDAGKVITYIKLLSEIRAGKAQLQWSFDPKNWRTILFDANPLRELGSTVDAVIKLIGDKNQFEKVAVSLGVKQENKVVVWLRDKTSNALVSFTLGAATVGSFMYVVYKGITYFLPL
ncbi:MAG: hypothetical protein R3A80_03605 [Bdellovibrionota bacterium]